jgi:hypothetical protein
VVPALAGRDALVVSKDKNEGGTWYRQHVTTNRPTNLFLQIGSSKPFQDSLGHQRFFSPLVAGFDALNTVHDLTLEPLMPGNDFFALVLVVDADGKWEEFVVDFTTKQRRVTVDFSEMFIINDGAVSGIGQAEFHIWVREGNRTIRSFFFGDVDNFDITTGDHIPLGPLGVTPTVIGPKKTTLDNFDVGILIRGLCSHEIAANEPTSNYFGSQFFPDDPSGNATIDTPSLAQFTFPTGAIELVTKRPFPVHTYSQVDGDLFNFNVTSLFTVEYF